MSDFYAIQYISTENTSEYAAELTLNHFLTVSVACVCVYIVFMISMYWGLGTRLAHFKKLPRNNVDIGRHHLSSQMRKKANASRLAIKQLVIKPYKASDTSHFYPPGKHQPLAYKTIVAESYQRMEKEITKQFPSLKRNASQDLRSYIDFLRPHFPRLTDTICDNYIKTYEVAKFSNHEWNSEMYQEWQTFFNEFMDALHLHNEWKNEHYMAEVPSPYTLGHPEYTEISSDIPEEDYVLDIALQDQYD